MADERQSDAGRLRVRDVESPLPRSSFGSIERYVEVGGDDRDFEPGVIEIEYSPEQLGWVDRESLRVFRVDVESRRWELVADSGPAGRGAVRARIEQPGIYGVVGLPKHPAVLEAVRRLCALPTGELAGERLSPRLASVCLQILCAPGGDRWTGAEGRLVPPGGSGDSVCDFCTGLHHPAGGLPECQLLAPRERPETITEAARAYAVTALGWVGVICPFGGCKFPAWIEVFELDPPRSTASYDIGHRWCTSLALSSTADRLYVADVSGPEVAAYDTAGRLVDSVPLAPLSGLGLLDCALSPDDATLYVAAGYALFVIDTATLTVSGVVSTDELLGGLAVSPDGATIAAAGAAGLHLVDTAALAHRSIAWPAAFPGLASAWAFDVAFVDAARVLAWDSAQAVLFDIDCRSGRASSLPTSGIAAAGGPIWNNTLLYAPSSRTAHVARSTSFGSQLESEIVTFDIDGGTWSSRQIQGCLTIPALTPSERVLVVEAKFGPLTESLAVYDPGSQQFSPDLCGVPFANVRDLKVAAA